MMRWHSSWYSDRNGPNWFLTALKETSWLVRVRAASITSLPDISLSTNSLAE